MSEENNVTWSIEEGPNLRDSLAINFFTEGITKIGLNNINDLDLNRIAHKAVKAADLFIKALEKDEA